MMPKKLLTILFLFIVFISGCQTHSNATSSIIPSSEMRQTEEIPLKIHFIDVGQADACLLESDGQYMMIDAGNNDDATLLVEHLKFINVQKLDYMIGTHLHEDHIGSMDTIIQNFDIGIVMLPRQIQTTDTYEDVLSVLSDKGLKITTPVPETTFYFNGIAVDVLTSHDNYDDLNNGSVVLKVEDKGISLLFTGDIEAEAEQDLLDAGYDLSADILKVAHHGSDSSSTEAFLDAVSPSYAVISVGEGNNYGHPDSVILDRLEALGTKIYRTDQDGTMTIETDGKNVEIVRAPKYDNSDKQLDNHFEPVMFQNVEDIENEQQHYIGNINSKKFHKISCNKLPLPENQIKLETKEDALQEGYNPCQLCNP